MLPAFALGWLLLASVPAAHASTNWYVSRTGVDGTCSQAKPFRTIQFALDCSSNLDTVFIAPGTYTQSLTVDFSVRLIGAGPGSTTISATHGVPGSTVYISHLYGTDVVISGVTVTGGNAQVQGGGIFNDTGYLGRSSLVLIDSVVAKNVAGAEGGGIYNEVGSMVELVRSRVVDNVAADGGGLYNDSGLCSSRHSEVAFNSPNDIVGC